MDVEIRKLISVEEAFTIMGGYALPLLWLSSTYVQPGAQGVGGKRLRGRAQGDQKEAAGGSLPTSVRIDQEAHKIVLN